MLRMFCLLGVSVFSLSGFAQEPAPQSSLQAGEPAAAGDAVAAPVAPAAEVPAQPVAEPSAAVEQAEQAAGDQAAASPPAAEAPRALDTLQSIMAKVWLDNPQVLQAEESLRASGYDITAARAAYLPYLQLQSAVADRSQDSISTLYVVLPLWDGGARGAQVGIAKARQRAALAELARTRLELGQRTLEAYFNIAGAQDQQIQWSNYVGALKKLLATIKRRADQGLAPQADVETAISRVKQAEAGAEANRAMLVTNRAQLASLLNATPGSLAWPEDSFILSDEEVAESARQGERHPAYLAARAEVEIQESTAKSAKASVWPEFSLQHRRQLDGVEFDPSNDATLVVMSYQTTNGVQGLLGYRAEQQRIAAVKARLEAVNREIAATVAVDRAQLTATAAQLEVQYEAAKATSALVDSYIRQFEAGRKTWLEVLNAQREANDTLIQSIALRRSYWAANAKLALDGMYWNRLGAEVVDETGQPVKQ